MSEAKKRSFRHGLFAVLLGMLILFNTSGVLAAEVKVDPGTSTATAPELKFGQEYYSTKSAGEEYFKLPEATGNGYYRIVLTNISVSGTFMEVLLKRAERWLDHRVVFITQTHQKPGCFL